MTECTLETAVPDWIIDHPETLVVFQELGIDDSCGGKSLGYLCDQQGLDRERVLAALHSAIRTVLERQDAPAQNNGEGRGHQ